MQLRVPAQAGTHFASDRAVARWALLSQEPGKAENLLFGPCAGRDHVPVRTMPFVYLLASKPYGTLYVGSTFELARRVWQHKTRAIPGFTAKYGVDRLVWFETHERLETALVRERQIKKWKRDWIINLIERENPHWADLYPSLSA
jgi:putative endonuclease